MKYFTDCKTAEELKAAYRKAAIKLHPDNGGSEEAFKEMQAEFSKVFDRLKNIHTTAEGKTYEATGDYATHETAEEFMNIINVVLTFDGVEIELCGRWLWFSGNTKEYKEQLKDLGCKWSANKKMWYWQNDGKRHFHKKAWSIDQIRNAYGSQSFRKSEEEEKKPRRTIKSKVFVPAPSFLRYHDRLIILVIQCFIFFIAFRLF